MAFDMTVYIVWKDGLTVSLWLHVNGLRILLCVGLIRRCLEIGVPQGSALTFLTGGEYVTESSLTPSRLRSGSKLSGISFS